MRDSFNMGQVPGQSGPGSFKANMNPSVIQQAAADAKKSYDLAVAATICHELGLHGMGGKAGHYHDQGFVDADKGGQIGANFSTEACDLIVDRLDIEPGNK
jgi:hypothetical protein